MPEDQDGSERQPGPESADLSAQFAFVKKTVVLLVLACLATSACLNVYVVGRNLLLQRQVDALGQQLRGLSLLHQFGVRIVGDLSYLSNTDQTARQLLEKYQQYIHEFNLDQPTRGASGR